MSRILEINPVYSRFFLKNLDERYLILRGGRRSGKSISVFQWITLLLLSKKGECIVLTATYPASTNAIKDFQLATGLQVTGNSIYGHSHIFENGSIISFKAFDDSTKAQGTMCDYAIVEEALNIDEQVFNVFSMSVKKQIFFLFNPTRKSWTDKYVKPDSSNYLTTNFKDNPYLTEAQIYEFELIKQRAEKPNATIWDLYNYKVYYKGDFSEMGGTVFPEIYTVTDEEYNKIPVIPSHGLDFGFVEGRDQTAMVSLKIHNNRLYIKQLIYSSYLGKDEDLVREFEKLGISIYESIPSDMGGLGKTRIMNIRENYGYDLINCIKHRVVDDLQYMTQFDRIYVTESSEDLRREMENYSLTPEGKPKGTDHLIDCSRYALNFARINYLY